MQQNNLKQSNQSEIEFNFIEIVRILLNSKRLIIIVTIAVGAIGWIYSSYFNPALPPNYESSSVIEIGSYPATDKMQSQSRDGRMLIASMDATITELMAVFGMHRSLTSGGFTYITEYDKLIHRIRIFELNSQFLKIEVVGATLDGVMNKTNEIIEYLRAIHSERLDVSTSGQQRQLQNIEEKLLVIGKFINTITKDNNIYISDVAELKLQEMEYNHELSELNMLLGNTMTYKNTDLIGEIVYTTNYPKSNITKLTLASFIIGLILTSLLVLIRYALAKYDKE